ncbi:hypothetical protein [Natrinema halophilum]|nr:hypothetical protein [Natrinema halophilum]UHQ96235.1 hypothetical protein HYG82_21365 [Natrinema halophilum]
MIAIALIEYSLHYEAVDPELSRWAWQLAADRFVEHDVRPEEADDELEIG